MSQLEARELQVSVVIPTRNRSRLTRELIESLWQQTLDPRCFEVIVVDNCSSDNTAEMIKELQASSPCRLVYQRTEENRGPGHARNTGARLAQAPVLAFTDSDCRTHPRWLELGLGALAAGNGAAFVSGPVRDKPEQPVTFFSLPTFANRGENPMYPGCNIFYRREVFWEAGGFDEQAWSGDVGAWATGDSDTDLALKIKQMGYVNVFSEEMVVYHEVWSLPPFTWLQIHFKAIQIPQVMKRNPSLRRLFWWGPFVLKENLFFYLALCGAVSAVFLGWWMLLLLLPHLVWAAGSAERFSLRRLPRIAGRIVFLTLRQVVMCGSLIYGSLRARTLVL